MKTYLGAFMNVSLSLVLRMKTVSANRCGEN